MFMNYSIWFGSDEQQYVKFTFGNSKDCNKCFNNFGEHLQKCLVSADDVSFTICYSRLEPAPAPK